jgi:hypothetical protein
MSKIEGDINAEMMVNKKVIHEDRRNLFAEMVRKTGSKQSVLDRLLQEIETLRESHRVTSRWPSAWELWVSRPDRNQGWVRYNIYSTHNQAEAAMKRVEGPPLELKIVPLYAVEEKP